MLSCCYSGGMAGKKFSSVYNGAQFESDPKLKMGLRINCPGFLLVDPGSD